MDSFECVMRLETKHWVCRDNDHDEKTDKDVRDCEKADIGEDSMGELSCQESRQEDEPEG